MPWRSLTIADVRLTPAEVAVMQNIQNSTDVGTAIATNVIGEFRDTIATAGTALDTTDATTLPDKVRNHAINRIRWLWLIEFPQLKAFQTKERSEANAAAEKFLADLASGKEKVPPGDGSSADQSPGPSFGTRGGSASNDPPCREFTKEKQDGI